jgi:gamma-glutamyltranspeptidase
MMSFEQVLQPAIDLAENGFPQRIRRFLRAETKKIKYLTTVKIYVPNGRPPRPARSWES